MQGLSDLLFFSTNKNLAPAGAEHLAQVMTLGWIR